MRAEQGVDLREWPVWRPEDPAATRRVRLRTAIASAAFLAFLVRNVIEEWGGSGAALVTVAVVYAASYLLTLYFGPLYGPAARTLLIGWLYVIGRSSRPPAAPHPTSRCWTCRCPARTG